MLVGLYFVFKFPQLRTILRKLWKQDGFTLSCLYPLLFNEFHESKLNDCIADASNLDASVTMDSEPEEKVSRFYGGGHGDDSRQMNGKHSDVNGDVKEKISEKSCPIDIFFKEKLIVIPSKYRPLKVLRDMQIMDESCVLMNNVLKYSKNMVHLSHRIRSAAKGEEIVMDENKMILLDLLLKLIPGDNDYDKLNKLWQLSQGSIDNILNAEASKESKCTQKGVKQIIEKKQGLFRSNLMGKRTNHTGRTVIAPCPNIGVDEVGVPQVFAKHLQYPEYVNNHNVARLRTYVINGLEAYPGAHMVEMEDGTKRHLAKMQKSARMALAKTLLTPPEIKSPGSISCKKVYRMLIDGDEVLMNRQPTLHRLGIQAHRAVIMKNEKVFRMPYANCKAYNADFDGDEMNMHFLQSIHAKSEAKTLMNTANNILTPKDGSPLAGLVQDNVVAGVKLSMRGNFFVRQDYQQLVSMALRHLKKPMTLLEPAIVKPVKMWSGKQIFSTILINCIPSHKQRINFKSKTSIKTELWNTKEARPLKVNSKWNITGPEEMTESEFVIRDGELVQGVMDKMALGAVKCGVVHACVELYGGQVATEVLTALNRVCVYYLQLAGHTIGAQDFLTPSEIADERRKKLKKHLKRTPKRVLEKANQDPEQFKNFYEKSHLQGNKKNIAFIDKTYNSILSTISSDVASENERGLCRRGVRNNMELMVVSGAKGTKVNMSQMTSLFGATAIDGQRMPVSVSGKTMPSYVAYDINPASGGYIASRFMSGMDPTAYFYLAIVGRDSMQHTAVKTANSGYVQRCIIKHCEGISVYYDRTVRNSDGIVLQFEYGEDGLDVMRTSFLKSNAALDLIVDNSSTNTNSTSKAVDRESIKKQKKAIKKYFAKPGITSKSARKSGFHLFCDDVKKENVKILDKMSIILEKSHRDAYSVYMLNKWTALPQSEINRYKKLASKLKPAQPEPLNSEFRFKQLPFSVVSEACDDSIEKYYSEHYSERPKQENKLSKEQVYDAIHAKVENSYCCPGEPVGPICAQAIGEPLTQMTLNTFHFAGRDDMNVTLGVPRMVEILRTATKKISTPYMEIPFHPHVTKEIAEKVKKEFSEITLGSMLNKVSITTIAKEEDDESNKIDFMDYKLRFQLIPTHKFKDEFCRKNEDVISFIEKYYIRRVINELIGKKCPTELCGVGEERKDLEKTYSTGANVEEKASKDDDNDEDEEDDNGTNLNTDDLDDAEMKRNCRQNEMDYDDDGDDEENNEGIEPDEGIESDEEQNQSEEQVSRNKRVAKLTDEAIFKRCMKVKEMPYVIDYEFDTAKEEWCEVTFRLPNTGVNYDVQSVIRYTKDVSYVYRVKGIKRAFVVDNDKNELTLKTEGVNIPEIAKYRKFLNVDRLYTNDIHLVANTYGIEAAQRSIITEIRAVTIAYGIHIDFRHLSLLAEYFTCNGVYSGCNRQYMALNSSPLQKMSFEATTEVLKKVVIDSEIDFMKSPSALVAVGQLINAGTNSFQLVDVDRIKELK